MLCSIRSGSLMCQSQLFEYWGRQFGMDMRVRGIRKTAIRYEQRIRDG